MKLLESYRLGELELPNRLVMAPMTRNRAPGGIPNEMMAHYYVQRATAGLMVSEGTQVAPLGQGYQDTPGIYTESQGKGWRKVTDAVHRAGGRIFAQLWHVGRVSHSYYHGGQPVAPSAIAPPGKAYTPEGMKPYEKPHALTPEEVVEVVEQFGNAARIAREAGFDGVEIHGANGYLIDQFLQSATNQRDDEYGGSLANRLRFLEEVTEAVVAEWPEQCVGVRLNPVGGVNGIHDEDPVETFSAAANLLNRFPLAYLHVVEGPVGGAGPDDHAVCATELVRPVFHGTLVSTGGYSPETAEQAVEKGKADLIGFGRLFIANPDLPRRIALHAALNEPRRETFYAPGPQGYIDYPELAA